MILVCRLVTKIIKRRTHCLRFWWFVYYKQM